MRSTLILSFIVILPLAASSACTDDTGSDSSNAGSGNLAGSTGGRTGTAGHGGNAAGTASAGRGADATAGAAGDGGAGPAQGGADNAGAAGDADNAGAAGAADRALQDGEILKVLMTVNQGEIAAGQTALAGAQAASVLEFAQMMVTEHSSANGQVLGLVATEHIAPQATDVSQRLEEESAILLLQLSTASPASFDEIYMQSQVAGHQEVLTLIDTRLTPGASDANLKVLLANTRTLVMTHVAHAETILANL